MIKKCLRCGFSNFERKSQVFVDGTVHMALICKDCGKHNSFAPKPKIELLRKLKGIVVKNPNKPQS